MKTYETDILIVGSGITAALMAARLSETTSRPDHRRRGRGRHDADARAGARARAVGGVRREPVEARPPRRPERGGRDVGVLAEHERRRPRDALGRRLAALLAEDFTLRSLYGVGDDWPFTYDELDPFYQEARSGWGWPASRGRRATTRAGSPYPLAPLPLDYNLALLSGGRPARTSPRGARPSAKNSVPYAGRAQCQRCDTCYPVCPTGAKYSPDFTWDALVAARKVELVPGVLVRRLTADARSGRIVGATGNATDAAGEPVTFTAKTFVLAGATSGRRTCSCSRATPRTPTASRTGAASWGGTCAGTGT
jgi:quinoprotein glucose dehydrogenase